MEKNTEACLICGKELVYSADSNPMKCVLCGREFLSNAACADGHYVCDECHSRKSIEKVIPAFEDISSSDPAEILEQLLDMPQVHMHGPEHHVLAGAAVLIAYHNALNKDSGFEKSIPDLKALLGEMIARGSRMPGGACGFWGGCGAALSCGAAYSIITETTPMSSDKWGRVNLLVSRILEKIGRIGGPRCCKRTTFIAVSETARAIREELGIPVSLSGRHICSKSGRNNECIKEKCPFFPASADV